MTIKTNDKFIFDCVYMHNDTIERYRITSRLRYGNKEDFILTGPHGLLTDAIEDFTDVKDLLMICEYYSTEAEAQTRIRFKAMEKVIELIKKRHEESK